MSVNNFLKNQKIIDMKQILLFLFVFLIGFNLSAQDFTINPNPVFLEGTYDLTDDFYIMKTHSTFTNGSTTDLELRWVVTEVDVPDAWEAQLCDKNACYAFGQYTNVDDDINEPAEVMADSVTILDLGVRHRGVGGCGIYRVDVTTIQDTTVILASNTYELRANVDADCNVIATSTNNFDKVNVKVFPNPTNDYFTITDNRFVKEVQIFNIVGKQMSSIPFENGKAINVMSLPNGLYLIRMLDADQQVLKTTRLTKR